MSQSVTLELDDETLQALDHLANRTERSRTEIISDAVRGYIEVQEWQLAKIQAGIAAADRGDFVSEEEIERIEQKYSARA
jgi:predicted transcriptional regulator